MLKPSRPARQIPHPMTDLNLRRGAANPLLLLLVAIVLLLCALAFSLSNLDDRPSPTTKPDGEAAEPLFVYCAAGIRPPIEKIKQSYEEEFGVQVQLQYAGSNTLLSQIEASQTGDLYITADDTYVELGREKSLVREAIPLAVQRPVIAVRADSPLEINSITDLLSDSIRTALGNAEQAAVGRKTRKLLTESGHWEDLKAQVTKNGVFMPTVPEVANNIKLGAIDCGVIWDSTVNAYPELKVIRVPELDAGESNVSITVLESCRSPQAALHFARYVGARDKGLEHFSASGFQVAEGDVWTESPELTFFCGSVNRRAVEPVIKDFEQREGARVNTVYNGCGILTGQMRTILSKDAGSGFPDTYMACDVYYLDTVRELFQDAVELSDTEVVIAVQKGNPKNIHSLKDLTKEGIRVTVGQPEQCTIGVLTKKVLTSAGVFDEVMDNVVTQTATSALLIPTVTTASADATLAYATDTLAESDKIDVIRISLDAAKAIQPFSIARSSDQKQISRRFYDFIASSRDTFENAGFHWRLEERTSAN